MLQDQDYTATVVNAGVTQRVGQYWSVSLSAGYVNSSYSATELGVNATREDNYFYVRPSVQWRALAWMSVGIFYEYDQDLSSGEQNDNFTQDRGGRGYCYPVLG